MADGAGYIGSMRREQPIFVRVLPKGASPPPFVQVGPASQQPVRRLLLDVLNASNQPQLFDPWFRDVMTIAMAILFDPHGERTADLAGYLREDKLRTNADFAKAWVQSAMAPRRTDEHALRPESWFCLTMGDLLLRAERHQSWARGLWTKETYSAARKELRRQRLCADWQDLTDENHIRKIGVAILRAIGVESKKAANIIKAAANMKVSRGRLTEQRSVSKSRQPAAPSQKKAVRPK